MHYFMSSPAKMSPQGLRSSHHGEALKYISAMT